MLVNIERARNANHPLRRVLLSKGLPFKQVLQLPGADVIRRLFFLLGTAPGTEVAAIAGNKLTTIAEPVHRQHAAVVAALEEHGGADTGPVVHGKALHIKERTGLTHENASFMICE